MAGKCSAKFVCLPYVNEAQSEAGGVQMQMAVFLVNTCKFSGCGLTFSALSELIQHIEDAHIDSDPRVLEKQELQQPAALALSYILRCYTDAARKESSELHRKKVRAQSPASSVRSSTPTGSEFDEDDEAMSEDDDSDDSWTTQREFTSEVILSMMTNKDSDGEKPFACPVPGCKKRYKNVNGIKYHAKHGHRKDTRVKKAFKCNCGKSYKTAQGLRNHTLTHHPPPDLISALQNTPPTTPRSKPLAATIAIPHTVITPSPVAIATQAPVTTTNIHHNGVATTVTTLPTTVATLPQMNLNSQLNLAAHTPMTISIPQQHGIATVTPVTTISASQLTQVFASASSMVTTQHATQQAANSM